MILYFKIQSNVSCTVQCIFLRGRHASKLTEEEEDAEYLKEEEDVLSGTGGTRLVAQPSCKMILSLLTILSACHSFVQHRWSLLTFAILVTIW